jgi:uncharacterized phage infection (PIP) family protein YhgE
MKQIHTKEYDTLIDLVDTLHTITNQYNDQIEKIKEMLEPELAQLNQLREKIESGVEAIEDEASSLVGDMEGYYEDRSEKWQESEAGEQYQEWTDAWSNIELPDVPEEVEVDNFDDLLVEVEMEDCGLPPRSASDL